MPSPTQPLINVTGSAKGGLVDPKKAAELTQQYFNLVVSDPGQAYAMTTGDLKDAGQDALQQRYGDYSAITVQRIEADGSKATTVATVQLTRRDGSVLTQRHELHFAPGDTPMVNADRTL
jgi:hypothetical protein